GVIQGTSADSYGRQVCEYVEMGYLHIAIGGLVPLSDSEILAIAQSVVKSMRRCKTRPWLHLFGVYRPKLQEAFARLGINSFDSATYFRKAWLRSDQNYLTSDGSWYAAIRVPVLDDPRTRKRLLRSGADPEKLRHLETGALDALKDYEAGTLSLEATLAAITAYDSKLPRREAGETDFAEAYRTTLQQEPWKRCSCTVCRELGIHALIFRGYNRNKRRGTHNTLMLYQ